MHTKGPWEVDEGTNKEPGMRKRLVDDNCPIIYHHTGTSKFGYIAIVNDGNGKPEKLANAHLIAAAPDMLVALTDAHHVILTMARPKNAEQSITYAGTSYRVSEAIRKARGE